MFRERLCPFGYGSITHGWVILCILREWIGFGLLVLCIRMGYIVIVPVRIYDKVKFEFYSLTTTLMLLINEPRGPFVGQCQDDPTVNLRSRARRVICILFS